jgi:MFS family permease
MIGFIALVIGVLLVFDVIHWLHLLGASIAQGAMFALQMPARQAAIPTLVGKERMGNAIALNAAAMGLMNLLGPALGGLIYGVFGPEAVYFTVAVMGLIAVLLTGFVPRLYPPVNAARKSAVNNIRDGFSYIQKNKLVRILIIQSVIIAVLSMPVRMLIPVFAKDVYGSNEAQVGYMAAAAGIGALVGSLGIANIREGQRRGLVVLASAILSGISILLLGSVPVYVLGVAVMVGVGLGESGRWALGQVLIMEKTDDEYRARVMSVVMMTFGLLPLGVLPLGAAIEAFGADTAVIGMAVMLLVAGTLFLMFSRNVRQLS